MAAFRSGFLGFCVLALSACATIVDFQYWEVRKGPVPVGTDWTDIHCPDPIVVSAPHQQLWLLIPVGSHVPNFHDHVIVFKKDGKRVALEAEVVDTEGRVHALTEWESLAMGITGRNRVVDGWAYDYIRLTSKNLPLSLRFNTIRLRSSSPIILQDVLWTSSRLPL